LQDKFKQTTDRCCRLYAGQRVFFELSVLGEAYGMSVRKTKRPMSEPEKEFLRDILKNAKTGARRWKIASVNAVLYYALSVLAFVVVWKVIAWVARATLNIEIGWHSPSAVWIAALGAVVCVPPAIISSVRWLKSQSDIRPDLRADLEKGLVIEEDYEFTATKRFQESEHCGLIYFLRTTDDKVLVLYDHESQELGAQGKNPLNSKFEPRKDLLIVRAPKTGFVISRQFSGAVLDTGEPLEISVEPQAWPEPETYYKYRWDELEKRLCK
jgi:hypothetical protein